MALTDAYATIAEYRSRATKNSNSNDAEIQDQLDGVSRFFDVRCNRFFNMDDSVQTRYYSGTPWTQARQVHDLNYESVQQLARPIFYLEDDIATTTGLIVTVDLDGDSVPETVLTIDNDFWIGPFNAGLGPEPQPYSFLQINPNSSVISNWPSNPRCLKIQAKFGWPAVPLAIKEAVCAYVREIRDLQEAGHTLTLQNLEASMMVSPKAAQILRDIEKAYGRARLPFV